MSIKATLFAVGGLVICVVITVVVGRAIHANFFTTADEAARHNIQMLNSVLASNGYVRKGYTWERPDTASPAAENLDLMRWRSSDASLKERQEAATRLVPKGTRQVDAEQILGEPTRTEHHFGPVFNLPPYQGPTNASFNVWCDLYDFSGGDYVGLSFDMNTSVSNWEDYPLLEIYTGNTNR